MALVNVVYPDSLKDNLKEDLRHTFNINKKTRI